MSRPTDLVQGTLDLLILKIIALEPQNGWASALCDAAPRFLPRHDRVARALQANLIPPR